MTPDGPFLTTSQVVDYYRKGGVSLARPEFPTQERQLKEGWVEVSGVYRVPKKATRAVVALHLKWAPGGRVEWSERVACCRHRNRPSAKCGWRQFTSAPVAENRPRRIAGCLSL